MAASAAATVRTSMVKIWPIMSPRNDEKATKLMFTDSSSSSIDIKITITFFLFRKIPKIPIVNRIAATDR